MNVLVIRQWWTRTKVAVLMSATTSVLMLYASKAGALLVGLLVLPQFSGLLGADSFGIVAILLSIQALLLTLDFGQATLVGRDVAAVPVRGEARRIWLDACAALSGVYAAGTPLVVAISLGINLELSTAEVVGCLLLFWASTLQNIGQAALVGLSRFCGAAIIQMGGVLLRAVGTLAALHWVDATLEVFIAAQAALALCHLLATSWACGLFAPAPKEAITVSAAPARAWAALRRGGHLVIFGAAGAAVMQLDKPLVAAMTTPADLAPYYLATMVCLTPLSALAQPVAQFFQPRVIRSLATSEAKGAASHVRRYANVLMVVTLVPAFLMWLYLDRIVAAWLADPVTTATVVQYAEILLPGAAIGALGFVPYVCLVARQDFRFQAWASAILSVATLLCVWIAARADSIVAVCWVYVGYHCVSTSMSWVRCLSMRRGSEDNWMIAVACRTLAATTLLAALLALVKSLNPGT